MSVENLNKILTREKLPHINIRVIIDREKVRVMQALGKNWPIKVEVIPLVDEGLPYLHDTWEEKKIRGIVPIGKVYTEIRTNTGDLTAFWATVSEISNENSRK